MKRIWAFILAFLCALPAQAQETTTLYLPLITKSGGCTPMTDPVLRVTDGTKIIDLLGPSSGWELADPYWQPQIAQFKGGGEYSNSGMAEGQQLTHREYDNVVETIPLSVRGIDQGRAIQTIRDLLQLGRQASDYWTESYEYDDVWLEVKPGCANSLTGYSRIIKMSIPELKNPFGQPFFSSFAQPVMEDISLIIEREPFWRGTPPGEIIGPLYNLIKNSDFELWNFGVSDSQPDSWTDLETLWITGQNSRDDTPKWNSYDLKIRVSGSTKAGASKGVTQVLLDTKNNTEYTVIAWVRSSGVSNGVGRILVTYSSQLELYRSSTAHGWTLYTGKITTGIGDVVAINCEILTTSANTDGMIYIDGLMFVEGDWVEEAENNALPYISSGHIVNHTDNTLGVVKAGDINYVDVWNIPGDVDALTRLIVTNNNTPANLSAPVEFISKLRIGMRRSKDVTQFDNINDPPGLLDATASSNNYLSISPVGSAWKTATTKLITSAADTLNNEGRYRVFARLYDNKATGDSNLSARLRYYIGTANIADRIMDAVNIPVRRTWTVVDLTPTKAMIWDKKFNSSPPSQLGYNVELSRTAGTDDAYLDYTLAIPTDGGYLEAEIKPPLAQNSALIADNTNSYSISGYQPQMTWTKFQEDTTGSSFSAGIQYGDYFYTSLYGGVTAKVIKFKIGQSPVVLYSLAANRITDCTIYNNLLYCNMSSANFYETDGNSFPTRTIGITGGFYWNSVVYDGKIYLASGGGPLYVRSWKTGDASMTNILTKAGASVVNFVEVYDNKLFVSWESQNLTYYDGTSWTDKSFGASRLKTYKGKMYSFSGANIQFYTPSGMVTVFTAKTAFVPANSQFIEYDGNLYVNDSGYNVYRSADGITWNEVNSLNGLGLVGTYNNFLIGGYGTASLYYTSTSGAEYQIADYQGGAFTSPPEKLHRWFFSWDRENYVNNVDDKALIGIGYVPRYLSLINYP